MGPYRRNSEDFEDAKDDESQRLAQDSFSDKIKNIERYLVH